MYACIVSLFFYTISRDLRKRYLPTSYPFVSSRVDQLARWIRSNSRERRNVRWNGFFRLSKGRWIPCVVFRYWEMLRKLKKKSPPPLLLPQHLYTLCRLKKFLCPEGSDSGSFFFPPRITNPSCNASKYSRRRLLRNLVRDSNLNISILRYYTKFIHNIHVTLFPRIYRT